MVLASDIARRVRLAAPRGGIPEPRGRSVTTRQLYFRFVDRGVQGVVDLYEAHAPETCATLWRALRKPVRALAFHAMYAGPEIMLGLPEEAQRFDPRAVPGENQTCTPGRGECLWYYQGKHAMKGLPDELWEIGLFYDHGGRTFGPLGWTPVNVFGCMRDGMEAFAAECRDIRMTGAKMLEIGRVERGPAAVRPGARRGSQGRRR
jgi:hypothetical protein